MILQIISLIGAGLLLVAYILFVSEKFKNESAGFHIMNFLGCAVLAVALWFGEFNLGSFVLQVTFALVALFAIVKEFCPKTY